LSFSTDGHRLTDGSKVWDATPRPDLQPPAPK
jgi:hypothetical protein